MDADIEKLKAAVKKSSSIVAVTGAGISVGSGGMTFSASSGSEMEEMTAVGSEEILRNDPERYYRALDKFFLHSMFQCGPSRAHLALARLEDMGKMGGIITTNVDCLHTLAGSKKVAEIQGSLKINICADCGAHYDDVFIWSHGKVPECTRCGGKIWAFPFYSHIGLYDEDVKKARDMIKKADLILIIGAEGNYGGVYWPYRNRKAKIIQINPGKTYFDKEADLNIRKGADEALSWILEEV